MSTLIESIAAAQVPEGAIALWWLGQAGYIFKTPGGVIAAIDPYLTNSCKAFGDEAGIDMDRIVPPPLAPSELSSVDALIFTHSHQDHLDAETLAGYRASGGTGPYFAPAETCEKLKSLGVPSEEIRMTWPNKEYSVGDVRLRATFAIPFGPDDLTHVGYLVKINNGPAVYFTGDTAYHEVIAQSVREQKPDVMVTVINGVYRNMAPADAAKLAREVDAQIVIPCHYDLFPGNCQSPQMLKTCLTIEGIGERYRESQHGVAWTFPEAS